MRRPRLIALGALDLRANLGRSLLNMGGIALGVWALLLVAALGFGTRDVVLREVVRELPVDMLEVLPRALDLGLFKLDAGSLFGGQALDENVEKRLRAMPEVREVYPRREVKLPLGATGGGRLFGRPLYTDLFMTALPETLLRDDGVTLPDEGARTNVVISTQLIELYNSAVATALGTPQLTASTLQGFPFDIVVGRSLMLGGRGARTTGTEPAVVAGVSRFAQPLGVTVGTATAQRLLQRYGTADTPFTPSALLVKARAPADVPAIATAVESMGLSIDQTAQRTRKLMVAGTALAASIGGMVLALAALNIAHSFVALLRERRRELTVMRAVGARRRHLMTLVLMQATAVGLAGGAVGAAGARVTAWICDGLAATWLPAFPFKPASFFAFSPGLVAAGLGAAVVAAVAGAAGPAWHAARRPITQGLQG